MIVELKISYITAYYSCKHTHNHSHRYITSSTLLQYVISVGAAVKIEEQRRGGGGEKKDSREQRCKTREV